MAGTDDDVEPWPLALVESVLPILVPQPPDQTRKDFCSLCMSVLVVFALVAFVRGFACCATAVLSRAEPLGTLRPCIK